MMTPAQPVPAQFALALLLLATGFYASALTDTGTDTHTSANTPAQPAYELIGVQPHSRKNFTQGLYLEQGILYESSGLYGQSTLSKYRFTDYKLLQQIELPGDFFAEGLTVMGGQLYLLSWREGEGRVYDASDLRLLGRFAIQGQGWGLTHHDGQLIMSNGSATISFHNPHNFAIEKRIEVRENGRPLSNLNELEWVDGKILANVWQQERIVRIDPATGRVEASIDFSGLLPATERYPDTNVMNGIAYDPAQDLLLLTGKRWPWLYKVRLLPADSQKRARPDQDPVSAVAP